MGNVQINWALAVRLFIGIALGLVFLFGLNQFAKSGRSIAIDTQTLVKCLPFSLSLFEPLRQTISKGDMVSIDHSNLSGGFRETTSNKLLKIVVGVEGDIVSRRGNYIYVNNKVMGEYHSKDPAGFSAYLADTQKILIGAGEYWVMGSYKAASDSRYVGPVKHSEFVEHATPLI
ncbi:MULTISPECIES: S26 family signal peptidase [Vibrio]|uniref:Signal peptidase I n=2 Tax=Vibrio TaxID=662 RepID=A0A510IEN6_9VIBR|nr:MULTISPECIES: S26 family signal peptidase [Vibrio]RTZ24621.1 hypothetical protein EKN09_02885 [Vibrio penaeicida]BBL92264.1 signal peptidase I [Vibrio rotiferianus]GLQ71121.1 signal peptidase I [Vibrio penaeicida]